MGCCWWDGMMSWMVMKRLLRLRTSPPEDKLFLLLLCCCKPIIIPQHIMELLGLNFGGINNVCAVQFCMQPAAQQLRMCFNNFRSSL